MDLAAWKRAWDLFMSDPITFGAAIFIFMGAAWWLRGFFVKERLAVKEERLQQARDNASDLAEKLTRLESKYAELFQQIQSRAHPEIIYETAQSSAELFRQVAAANSTLQSTLKAETGHFGVTGHPVKLTVTRGTTGESDSR